MKLYLCGFFFFFVLLGVFLSDIKFDLIVYVFYPTVKKKQRYATIIGAKVKYM